MLCGTGRIKNWVFNCQLGKRKSLYFGGKIEEIYREVRVDCLKPAASQKAKGPGTVVGWAVDMESACSDVKPCV